MSDATKQLRNPEFWRLRAEEVRTVASELNHGEPRAIMLRIAEGYEQIAKLVEHGMLQTK